MKKPLGRCTVRAATASVPTTADAATGVPAPAISATPVPVSTAALVMACSRGCRKPIEENQRAVPSRVRPCRTPWAIIVAPIVTRRPSRATSIPFTPPTLAEQPPAVPGRKGHDGRMSSSGYESWFISARDPVSDRAPATCWG